MSILSLRTISELFFGNLPLIKLILLRAFSLYAVTIKCTVKKVSSHRFTLLSIPMLYNIDTSFILS